MTSETPDGLRLGLASEAATARLGQRIGRALEPGDAVMLVGPLGAGKSVLARAMVRTCLGDPAASVPSPSYTLVNVYDTTRGELWHADLYRLGGADEALELGLLDALGHAILIVEWPDRLGSALPARRLEIALEPRPAPGPAAEGAEGGDEPREAVITPHGPGWEALMHEIGRAAA